MEQKKLKGADQEKELVVAAIYKVGALSQQKHRWAVGHTNLQGSSEKQRRHLRRMVDSLLRNTKDPSIQILLLSDKVIFFS